MNSKTLSITCIDTLYYKESSFAVKKTIETLKNKIDIKCLYWFSDINFPEELNIPVNWVKIKKMPKDFNDMYSEITLKLCPKHCIEDYNLIVQYDGFAINNEAWIDSFLSYDYIGAPWTDGIVGNGGFSLRSRKLYDALLELNPETNSNLYDEPEINVVLKDDRKYIPEDVIIGRILRNKLIEDYDIKFAPKGVASRFSVEYVLRGAQQHWRGRSLGFHGKHGISKFYGFDIS
jgi:hypothetical protein